MRKQLVLATLLSLAMIPFAAKADVSIGINLALYPDLVRVPGYPVYYAPDMDSNYFFYDGSYWVYADDSWYASSWYNGPWQLMDPEIVPLYVLRIPVRYYRRPPGYFHDWSGSSPPHWGEHWGNDWAQHHRNWNHWNHHATAVAAPLPVYQRHYSGNRYPQADQQQQLQRAHYRYQPHNAIVQQHFTPQQQRGTPAPARRVERPLQSGSNSGAHAIPNAEQRNDHNDNAKHLREETPRASSSAQQPRQSQAEQHTSRHQRSGAPRTRNSQSDDHDQRRNQQQHRENNHD